MSDKTPTAPDTVRLKVNDKEIEARKGEMIIEAAGRHGIYVPHYCWHPGLSIAGNCRLCLVEVAMFNPREGKAVRLPKAMIACQTVVADKMEVWTDSPLAKECQSGMMEFLLANHPLDCPICDRGGECMLQRYSMDYGRPHSVMVDRKRKFKKPEFDSLIDIERNRCIMCTRCVRFCDEVAGDHVLGVFGRGNDNYISTFGAGPVSSIFSGNVIDICPVGCLTSKPYRFRARPWELAQSQSTCANCASGCKVTYWTRNGRLYRVTPPSRKRFDEFTLNEDTTEWICNIGRFASDYALHEDRLVTARIRDAANPRETLETGYDGAIEAAKARLSAVRDKYGADSIAVLVSPRMTLEDGYVASRLAREVLGTPHIDWRTWPATRDAADAASRAFANANGDFETPPDVILVVNGDLKNQAPITALAIKENARLRGSKVILLGHHLDAWLSRWASRRHHCAPGATASRLAALAALVTGKEIGLGFDTDEKNALAGIVKSLVEAKRGVIVQCLEDLGGAHAPEETAAVRMLCSALGTGWKSLPVVTGRNAVGLFAVGAQPDRLPGGSIHNQAAVKRAVETWKTNLPEKAGLAGPEILQAAADGAIKGLVLLGQDVLASAPDQDLVSRALGALESVVVLDLFRGNAAERADVFLPITAQWETEGTYADLEGNLARLTQGERPVGASRVPALILADLGRALGAGWDHLRSVEAVFNEMKSFLAPDSPIGFTDLELEGPGREFPIRERSAHETPGLARRRTPEYNPGDFQPTFHLRWDEEAGRTIGIEAIPATGIAPSDALTLIWGPNLAAGDPYTRRSSGAEVLRPAPYIEIHPEDAQRLGIEDRETIHLGIDGVEGEVPLQAVVCEGPPPRVAYVAAGLIDIRLGRLARLPRIRLSKPELVRS